VSLLRFVDDTLVVCQEKHQDIITIKTILRYFEPAYGLEVNFPKTRLRAMEIESQQLLVFANMLNCAHMNIPFKYLGV